MLSYLQLRIRAVEVGLLCTLALDIPPWTFSVPQSSQFPRASLSENCSLLGTDNALGQISVHIFAPNRGYCLYITSPPVILSN